MTGIFIALISGALMSLQGIFNTEVTKQSSMWVSASWVQFSALLTCLTIWAASDRSSFSVLVAQLTISWGVELLGMFGVEKGDFSIRKLLGLLIAVAGVILFEWES